MKVDPSVIIVGIVRNCEKTFEFELDRLIKSFSSFRIVGFCFVESDSTDSTPEILKLTGIKNSQFHFMSLGELSAVIPERVERLRFCRNKYVSYIRDNFYEYDFDFAVVADMDGINSSLTKFSVNACFNDLRWDAVFSNQAIGVSDLLALRAKNWIEEDYLFELEQSRRYLREMSEPLSTFAKIQRYLMYDKTRKSVIYSRMRYLGFGKQLIPVDSAFGGIAIYRSWCFFLADYSTTSNPRECEHVSFHRSLARNEARLYICPRFVNSFLNTYNINKFFLVRLIRFWKWSR
jgi:hypothetical protein